MTIINASLFAHIENDANLSGTYKLEGNLFSNTAKYLADYLDQLLRSDQAVPENYFNLFHDLSTLVEIEAKLDAIELNSLRRKENIANLGSEIAKKITALQIGEKITLPGGWSTKDGGHAMIYQFIRTADGYDFTAYNAGGGINYHAKKSSKEKELYNPTKTWHFPTPQSLKDKTELGFFVERLLKPRMVNLPENQKKAYDGERLYEEILASISFINGVEVDDNKRIPEHAYTGGQLSGTCAQRCIHQMLKINSSSAQEYERFIFRFKQFALFDYADECLAGKQPFTHAVRHQINLALENNLKILNTQGLFSTVEKQSHLHLLKELKTRVNSAPVTSFNSPAQIPDPIPQYSIVKSPTPLSSPPYAQAPVYESNLPKLADFTNLRSLHDNLQQAVTDIRNLKTPANQYHYLEHLISSLPISSKPPFHKDYSTLHNCLNIERQLNEIQLLIQDLQSNWMKDAQNPSLNAMALIVFEMQINLQARIAEYKNLPSFKTFSESVMETIVGNNTRNPYWATNHPVLDKKIVDIQEQYKRAMHKSHHQFYDYLTSLMTTELNLKTKLDALYQSQFGAETSELHKNIKIKGLGALYLISQHINSKSTLPSEFNPIVQKIREHLAEESKIRRLIKPFFKQELSENLRLDFVMADGQLLLYTPLYASFIGWQEQSDSLTKHKYLMEESPARRALLADVTTKSTTTKPLTVRTANHIQLHPDRDLAEEKNQELTQEDIVARDYLHLRNVPSLQIALTLDYFKRHIDKLASVTEQRYVMANLFQPGLLVDALKKPTFLPQLEEFLKTGFRFFNQSGQFTKESLFFLQLNYQVSRYLYLMDKPAGLQRLEFIQDQLLKQLSLPNEPEMTYVIQQQLFLTLMTRLELGEESAELFEIALQAYFYIQGHADPFIEKDISAQTDLEMAVAKFQLLIQKQSAIKLKAAVVRLLKKQPETQDLQIKSVTFPIYKALNSQQDEVEVNVLLGKLFESKLAHSGVPIHIHNHPLIKHLGLQDTHQCLMTANGEYMVLNSDQANEARLYYRNDKLTVQKKWRVNGLSGHYELQALTAKHQAYYANQAISIANGDLPAILLDGTMDYWQDTRSPQNGILVKNNVPIYAVRSNKLYLLDEQGQETSYQLSSLEATWRTVLNKFESNQFILPHVSLQNTKIQLPRFNLNFAVNMDALQPYLIEEESGERVDLSAKSPIHTAVAGLVLTQGNYQRYLVPVARFYATKSGAEQSDYYPVVHDTKGSIATAILEEEWTRMDLKKKPLWNYQNSERHISFRLQDGEPIADTVADALYLAYIYLSTNQPEKAWKILQDCKARFGGLTGDPQELKFISWICQDLPHLLPGMDKDAVRETPPYVACQLKTTSMLSDFLLQGRKFDLKTISPQDTANSYYEASQQKDLQNFLNKLPDTIYKSFSRYQTMRRHLEQGYSLSMTERKRLLDYYQQSQPKGAQARGSLGYEWLALSLETIQQERDALLARQQVKALTPADSKRLASIEKQLKQLKPVVAKSTSLELIAIDLTLSSKANINLGHLDETTRLMVEGWKEKLPGRGRLTPIELKAAVAALTSKIREEDFLNYFPAYFQLAFLGQDAELTRLLLDFCEKNLLANRHIKLEQQDSNIPLLTNILYRICHNRNRLSQRFNREEVSLSEIISSVSNYNIPELKIYQAKDVYKNILATPAELLSQERPVHKPLITLSPQNTSLLEHPDLQAVLKKLNRQPFDRLTQAYKTIHKAGVEKIEAASTEDLAGKLIFDLEVEERNLAQGLIDEPALASLIQNIMRSILPNMQATAEQVWIAALKLANEGPEDPINAQAWEIDRQAKARALLEKSDLLALFCRADQAYSLEKTGLSPEKTQQLHHLIHLALFQDIQVQMVNSIEALLKQGLESGDTSLLSQALDILTKEKIPALDDTATVIIQHEDDILLRPRQVDAIKSLLAPQENGDGFKETIEKIPPGGGKSKKILPVIAEKKAQGNNLVIIEVPTALLETNYVDLNRSSQRLFGKAAYRFEFDRDTDSSPEHLQQIYEQFTEVMSSRSYLVTTGEAMQSLELKYIELLLLKDRGERWQEQVYWLDKLTNLVRYYGDCIIDEVHQGLWIKKKLNYTLGEPKPIGPELINNATVLYRLIAENFGIDFIRNAPTLPDNYDWTAFKETLAKKLILESNSPLYSFVIKAKQQYGASENELIAYLMGTVKTMPEAVIQADPEQRAMLGFYKKQISSLLPETLRLKLNVNYGATKRQNLSPIEYTLAIPYVGNEIANEQSRFGNELEAINFSIQMMLIKGLSKELLMERLAEWQALARQELFQNPDWVDLEDTPTAKGFALLTGKGGITLSEINLKNPEQMEIFYEHYRHNGTFIFNLLKERVLKQISHDAAIIHSDAFNHVDVYRSTQGVSGTPENHSTYHQRLRFDPKVSLGTDGYFIELLHSKNTQVNTLDYQNAGQFVTGLINQSKNSERTRAIIDINASFTGVSNIGVAKEIVYYIQKNPGAFSHDIKYVLYFNDDQVLCALDANKPEKPIILGTSDEEELNRLLRTTPEQRFTYYDQVHTLGTDLKQYTQAHAIVLADDLCSFQAYEQGSRRFRGLDQRQTMEVILPQRLAGMTLQELMDKMQLNDKNMLWLDNLFAAKAQMINRIRRTVLTMIQALPSEEAERKADLMQKMEQFFKDTPSLDLFALYGSINRKQKVGDILEKCKKETLALWTSCYQKAGLNLSENEQLQMDEDLQTIINTAIPYCLPEYEGSDDSFAKEVQIQKEVQKQVLTQRIELNTRYNNWFSEIRQQEWPRIYAHSFMGVRDEMSSSLNNCCETSFFEQLNVSNNYIFVYVNQEKPINAFLKPIFLVWYHEHQGKLHATIVTHQEAEQLAASFAGCKNSWIATTEDTVIHGKAPEQVVLNPDYQSLREQVRFFNGEFASLLNQETPLIWLSANSSEKLDYFENNLQRFRPGSETEIPQLKAALTQGSVDGFIYIAQHPFNDLTEIDWQQLFPKIIPVQATEYKKVAQAFAFLNQTWSANDSSLSQITQQFGLAINSFSYVNEHLQLLRELKAAMDTMFKKIPQPFLRALSNEQQRAIERCLGIPLSTLLDRQGVKLLSSYVGPLSEASIEVLNLLRHSPAFESNRIIMDYFETLAAKTYDDSTLLALLKIDKPSEKLILTILNHDRCNDEMVAMICNLDLDFSQEILLLMAKNCQNDETIQKILPKKNISKEVLELLVRKAKSSDSLYEIVSHPEAKNLPDWSVLKHPALSPKIVDLWIRSNHRSWGELPEAIFREIVIADENDVKTEWNNSLISLFSAIAQSPLDESYVLERLSSALKTYSSFISPEVGLASLNIKGLTAIADLPIDDMVKIADEKQLGLILGQNDELFEKELLAIAQKSTGADLLSQLLSRKEVNDAIVSEVLGRNLNEQQLLLALKSVSQARTLERIYNHPNVTKTVRLKVCSHPSRSEGLILSLLEKESTPEPEILEILRYAHAITPGILSRVAEKPCSSSILKLLVLNDQADAELMNKVMDNIYFSLKVAQAIIAKCNVTNNNSQLIKLFNKAFQFYQDASVAGKEAWADCLINIAQKYQPDTTEYYELLAWIKDLSLTPRLSLSMLKIFGQDLVSELSLSDMINVADDEGLETLIDMDKTGPLSKDLLIKLAKHSHSAGLIDQLLKRSDLSDSVYDVLLKKDALGEEQLLLILSKVSKPVNVENAFYNTGANLAVRRAVYNHSELSVDFIKLNLINIIKDGEVRSVLQNPRIDESILSNFAARAQDTNDLLAILSHHKATTEVRNVAIDNGFFSTIVAQKIIDRAEVATEHELLTKLSITVLEKCQRAEYKAEWESCLKEILLKYKDEAQATDILVLMKNYQMSPELGFQILAIYSQKMNITTLPLTEMVNLATNDELLMLCDASVFAKLPKEIQLLIAEKCQTTEQIAAMVKQENLPVTLLQVLFNKAPPYETMQQILKHNKITEDLLKDWYAQLKALHTDHKKQIKKEVDPEKRLLVSIEGLKVKACSHAIKALHDEKYEEVASSALKLHFKLQKAVNDYTSDRTKENAEVLQARSKTVIERARPVLGQHRGYAQAFADIFNAVFAVFAFKWGQYKAGNWRFFDPKTDTLQAAVNIQENIENVKPKAGG